MFCTVNWSDYLREEFVSWGVGHHLERSLDEACLVGVVWVSS